jgi:hypothetical protein
MVTDMNTMHSSCTKKELHISLAVQPNNFDVGSSGSVEDASKQ